MSSSQLQWIIVISAMGLAASVVSYGVELTNNCSIRQLDLAGEVKKYDTTHDAQFCDALNSKISKYDNECKPSVEEIDCG